MFQGEGGVQERQPAGDGFEGRHGRPHPAQLVAVSVRSAIAVSGTADRRDATRSTARRRNHLHVRHEQPGIHQRIGPAVPSATLRAEQRRTPFAYFDPEPDEVHEVAGRWCGPGRARRRHTSELQGLGGVSGHALRIAPVVRQLCRADARGRDAIAGRVPRVFEDAPHIQVGNSPSGSMRRSNRPVRGCLVFGSLMRWFTSPRLCRW